MADAKHSTTKKILRSHRRAVGWTFLLWNLLVLVLTAGLWLVWHMQAYAGGWEHLGALRLTYLDLIWDRAASVIRLTMLAVDREQIWWDVTTDLQVFLAAAAILLLAELLIRAVVGGIWQASVRRHMQQVTLLAQEARRLGAEEARRSYRPPQVDVLEEAIDHISPTENTRLHIGDPDLQGLEEAINDLLDRMQAAYSQQSRFVSDASHELRTPIAVLKGYADLLERWGKDDPQVRDEAIRAIQDEAERMSRLVEQLLFLARGDSGRTQLQMQDLDLSELLREVYEEYGMIDLAHKWQLDAPQPVPCRGDRDMLRQALRILSDNAVKYTPEGKTVTLRAFVNGQGRPCMAVRDEGMGIRAEDAPHVFERFYRSDPARSRQHGGAGLGLSIAHWIVTSHGGHLEMYSWEGIGTRFTVVL